MGSRLERIKRRTRSIPLRTYNTLVRRIPEEVVCPLPYILGLSGSAEWPYSVRSPAEKMLSGEKASLMERMRLDERIVKRIRERKGKKPETLVKVCYRCFRHELGYRTKGFGARAAEIFKPRAAFEYSFEQPGQSSPGIKRRRIYGVVFEQKEKIAYSWNKKEISDIRLATSKDFKRILGSQVMQLVPAKPSNRKDLRWLVSRVVELNFDFGPYTLPLRSVYTIDAKDVYPVPIPSTRAAFQQKE